MKTYKWKWMVLGGLVCMNNEDFEKKVVNDNIKYIYVPWEL